MQIFRIKKRDEGNNSIVTFFLIRLGCMSPWGGPRAGGPRAALCSALGWFVLARWAMNRNAARVRSDIAIRPEWGNNNIAQGKAQRRNVAKRRPGKAVPVCNSP